MSAEGKTRLKHQLVRYSSTRINLLLTNAVNQFRASSIYHKPMLTNLSPQKFRIETSYNGEQRFLV